MELAARTAAWSPSGAPLPYDAEVEYLESVDFQWLDTGIVPVEHVTVWEFAISAQSASYNRYFCGTYASGNARFSVAWRTGDIFELGFGSYYYSKTNVKFVPDAKNVVILDAENNRAYLNGNDTGYRPPSSAIFADLPIALFIRNGSTGTANAYACKIYYSKMWEYGEVVQDLIPVRFTNENGVSEGAMYDRVSGQLFRNAGTGAFVIGPDNPASNGGGYKCLTRSSRSYWRSRASRAILRRHLWKEVA